MVDHKNVNFWVWKKRWHCSKIMWIFFKIWNIICSKKLTFFQIWIYIFRFFCRTLNIIMKTWKFEVFEHFGDSKLWFCIDAYLWIWSFGVCNLCHYFEKYIYAVIGERLRTFGDFGCWAYDAYMILLEWAKFRILGFGCVWRTCDINMWTLINIWDLKD